MFSLDSMNYYLFPIYLEIQIIILGSVMAQFIVVCNVQSLAIMYFPST